MTTWVHVVRSCACCGSGVVVFDTRWLASSKAGSTKISRPVALPRYVVPHPPASMETVAASLDALALADEPVGFSSLPDEVAKKIFSGLPLDTRLRSREVSPVWCALLEDVSLWQRLDFSKVAARRLSVAPTLGLVRAAIARAKGTLHTLNLVILTKVSLAALVELVAENGKSLRTLTTPEALDLGAENVARLRLAAPLCELNCRVKCEGAEVVALLGCELVCPFYLQVHDLDTQQQQTDFATALASRTGVMELWLVGGNLVGGATLEGLARATVAAGVERIAFIYCRLTPMALPALTLLLRPSVLRSSSIYNADAPLFTGPDLPAFCHALRSYSSLRHIKLCNCDLWTDSADAGMVLAALAARTTPFNLGLDGNRVGKTQEEQFAAGTQLAQLITADRLVSLELIGCNLGEAGLAPIFEALSVATRLESLKFSGDLVSREFARDVVLPAVRANISLRRLSFTTEAFPSSTEGGKGLSPELVKAQNIVTARR